MVICIIDLKSAQGQICNDVKAKELDICSLAVAGGSPLQVLQ
jgi:hypothetical protein